MCVRFSGSSPVLIWRFSRSALLQSAMHLLVAISSVEDQEVFKICLEYWNILASDLYHSESQFQPPPQSALVLTPATLSPTASPRRQLYAPILSKLRVLLVSRMAKPEEVLIVEDENGEIVRETMKDSDAITLYKTMRETLVSPAEFNGGSLALSHLLLPGSFALRV